MPKPVARNGTVRPWKVLYQPSCVTVVRLVMNVTSKGIMSVARTTMNSVRLNGKRRKANA